MYIKSFGINIDKSKRLWAIIFIALLVAVTLIATSFIFVFNNSNKSNISKLSDLFEAKSYYAEYDMKIVSNKNENYYKIKEWYVNSGEDYKFRIETNNKENNFAYFGNQNSIYIKSDEQLSFLSLSEYNLKRANILSISSVMEFLNEVNLSIKTDSYVNNNCCKIEEIEADTKLKYTIYFKEINDENGKNGVCGICEKFIDSGMKINKIEVILDNERLIPMEYNIYYEDEQMYTNVIYNKFSINEEFDEKLFAF